MNNFFRSFFAALLALVVFFIIVVALVSGMLAAVSSSVMSGKGTPIGDNAVLVLDLSDHFSEVAPPDPIGSLLGNDDSKIPSLYDAVRMIGHAKNDASIKGIYIKCAENRNDFASSDELRNALMNFRSSGKFVYAYANNMSQKGYYVANVATKLYLHPKGGLEWHGFAMEMPFIKGSLERLEIEPQIFYAGKFKSATEPLRETKMTDANRLQSNELLHDIYGQFLSKASQARNIDTALLHHYADSNALQFAADAFKYKMVDGLKYDDEVKDEIKAQLKLAKDAAVNFVSLGKYSSAVTYKQDGADKIAVIYAEGNIVDGNGERNSIGGDTYRNYIRKARLDNSIKAIVIRVNSGGGSAMASEVMWREVELAKKTKPVIVSFGDVAASGGYYMSCAADSIFAQPNTITGSIGVFGLLPNFQKFFNNKLGVTFDEVHTSPDANFMSITRPLSASQRKAIQDGIDTTYLQFKTRVAEGRKKSVDYIDSIAQGRVWSGSRALELGLVDRIGGIGDAIAAAAKKARINDYRLREYPAKQGVLDMFIKDKTESEKDAAIKEKLGVEGYKTYTAIRNMKQFMGKVQARMPFEISIQ
ncbi:MAG: signal peptide peptidase SppA [Chitinophagaceae bacterium]|nr:signal peptide peptidase SppA [Chitinophagaceae bacterium]